MCIKQTNPTLLWFCRNVGCQHFLLATELLTPPTSLLVFLYSDIWTASRWAASEASCSEKAAPNGVRSLPFLEQSGAERPRRVNTSCRVQFTDEALLDFWASPFKVFLTEISSVPFEATGMWSNSGEESPAGVCGVFLQSRCFVCAGPAARWLWVLLSSSLISEGRCSLSRRQNRPASNPSVKTGLHSQMSICIPNHASLAVWKDKNRRIIFNEARGEN